ncbi:MAG: hypothetical protein OEV06_01945 [Anaerolineae bacterium]|nr:hypothetical protein [Anaerolineae bacterium]
MIYQMIAQNVFIKSWKVKLAVIVAFALLWLALPELVLAAPSPGSVGG